MREPLATDDDLGDFNFDEESEPGTDLTMTLLVFGMMALLLVVIAAILIAGRRPPAGL